MISKTEINDLLISASAESINISGQQLQCIDYVDKQQNIYKMLHSSTPVSSVSDFQYQRINGNICVLPVCKTLSINLIGKKKICV